MAIGTSFGSDSVKLLVSGAEQLLGRPLQDSEKAMVADLASQLKDLMSVGTADLKSVIDYLFEKLQGQAVIITFPERKKQ